MLGRLFRHKQKPHCGRRHRGEKCCARVLGDFAANADVVVVANSDHKTLEMGIFAGVPVHVLKNRPADSNMVVAVGDSRYIIPRKSADLIKVR